MIIHFGILNGLVRWVRDQARWYPANHDMRWDSILDQELGPLTGKARLSPIGKCELWHIHLVVRVENGPGVSPGDAIG